MRGYPPLAIANYFIERAVEEGAPVDHLKLQKLVYIAHGWHLAVYGEPLLRERVEAWQYGPVIRSLYHELKKFGNRPIGELVPRLRGTRLEVPRVHEDDEEALRLLDRVWNVYKDYTGVQLSNLTHQEDTPWGQTWEQTKGHRNVRIDNHLIEEHFRELGSRQESAAS